MRVALPAVFLLCLLLTACDSREEDIAPDPAGPGISRSAVQAALAPGTRMAYRETVRTYAAGNPDSLVSGVTYRTSVRYILDPGAEEAIGAALQAQYTIEGSLPSRVWYRWDGGLLAVAESADRDLPFSVLRTAASACEGGEAAEFYGGCLNTPPRRVYAFPLSPGRTWDLSVGEAGTFQRQVETMQDITVEAGTFRTAVVRTDLADGVYRDFVAEEGLVLREWDHELRVLDETGAPTGQTQRIVSRAELVAIDLL